MLSLSSIFFTGYLKIINLPGLDEVKCFFHHFIMLESGLKKVRNRLVILSPFSNVRKWLQNGNKKPLVTDRWSLSVTGCFLTIFSPFEMGHKITFIVRKLGHKRGHFITVSLQHENICKMVRKVINNLLFRQGCLVD